MNRVDQPIAIGGVIASVIATGLEQLNHLPSWAVVIISGLCGLALAWCHVQLQKNKAASVRDEAKARHEVADEMGREAAYAGFTAQIEGLKAQMQEAAEARKELREEIARLERENGILRGQQARDHERTEQVAKRTHEIANQVQIEKAPVYYLDIAVRELKKLGKTDVDIEAMGIKPPEKQ